MSSGQLPSRRAVVRSAAWTAPVLALPVAAPAQAATSSVPVSGTLQLAPGALYRAAERPAHDTGWEYHLGGSQITLQVATEDAANVRLDASYDSASSPGALTWSALPATWEGSETPLLISAVLPPSDLVSRLNGLEIPLPCRIGIRTSASGVNSAQLAVLVAADGMTPALVTCPLIPQKWLELDPGTSSTEPAVDEAAGLRLAAANFGAKGGSPLPRRVVMQITFEPDDPGMSRRMRVVGAPGPSWAGNNDPLTDHIQFTWTQSLAADTPVSLDSDVFVTTEHAATAQRGTFVVIVRAPDFTPVVARFPV